MPSASFIVVNDVTASPLADGRPDATRLRVVSGAVLAAVALAALYTGWPAFDLLVLAAAVIMAREWANLCGAGRRLLALPLMAVLAGAVLAMSLAGPVPGLAAVLVAALLAVAVARFARIEHPSWTALGTLYMGAACVAALWLRGEPGAGRDTMLWLFAVVWATDIGGYVIGRGIGGRRLAPRISPNKTWAGLFGGVAAAVAVAALVATAMGALVPWRALALAAVLSLVAQGGDLLESTMKRRFGVKDTGHLIPGHGGLLDRIDSLMAATLALAILHWASGGVPIWR